MRKFNLYTNNHKILRELLLITINIPKTLTQTIINPLANKVNKK